MKRKISGFTLFAQIVVLVLIGAAGPVWANGGNMEKQPDVVLQKQDNGKEITLKSGQEIQVQLEAMGGAGYWWYVQDLDPRYFEMVSEKTRGAAADGRVGGPVLGLWTFRAKEPGSSEIKMDYYRTWEGAATAAEHFRVKIRIE